MEGRGCVWALHTDIEQPSLFIYYRVIVEKCRFIHVAVCLFEI
jgi:hypothetical protein